MEYIYVVYEENHGDVSWWSDKEKAEQEAYNIIDDMYDGEREVMGELVGVNEQPFNSSWL